jgi:hypothetical protein
MKILPLMPQKVPSLPQDMWAIAKLFTTHPVGTFITGLQRYKMQMPGMCPLLLPLRAKEQPPPLMFVRAFVLQAGTCLLLKNGAMPKLN